MAYTYEYYFIPRGTTRETHSNKNNEIWLDIGGKIEIGTFDHHNCSPDKGYTSTVDILVNETKLLEKTKEALDELKPVRIYLHKNPDMDAIFSCYYLQYYLDNGIEAFKEKFILSKIGKTINQYVNDIDSGKNKKIDEVTLYNLISHFDRRVIPEWSNKTETDFSNEMLNSAFEWIEIAVKSLEENPLFDLYQDEIIVETNGDIKTIKKLVQEKAKNARADYDRDKQEGRLIIKEIPIWTKDGKIEMVKAAIWNKIPSAPSTAYIFAREEGAIITFVPHNEYGGNGVRVSINPDVAGAVEKYSLTEVGEMYEQTEQIYEQKYWQENGRLRRDYSRPRGGTNSSVFAKKPFAMTADPWYVSEKGDMVDAPGKGSLLPTEVLIEILENVTKQIRYTHTVDFDLKLENFKKKLQPKINYAQKEEKSLRDWTKEMREAVRNIGTDQYKFFVVEVDAALISRNYDILDAYFMNLSGGAYIDNAEKKVMRVDYRTHLYVNQGYSVLFVATAENMRTMSQMKGLLNWESSDKLYTSAIVDIFAKILTQRQKFKEIGNFFGESKFNHKKIKKKNEELIKLLADSQADECIDSQIELDVFQFVYESLDVQNLRHSVKETMDMVSLYSKERTYERLNSLSAISIPFILVTTILQVGVIKFQPLFDWEVAQTKIPAYIPWAGALAFAFFVTVVAYGFRWKK